MVIKKLKNMSYKEAWKSPSLTVIPGDRWDKLSWLQSNRFLTPIPQVHFPPSSVLDETMERNMSYKWWTLQGPAHNLPSPRTSMFCLSSLTHMDMEILGVHAKGDEWSLGLPINAWRAVVCQLLFGLSLRSGYFMAAARVILSPIYHINIFFSKMNLKTLL